jgi:hypothetical protein
VGRWDSHSWLSSCSFASQGTRDARLGKCVLDHESRVTSHGLRNTGH